MSEKKFKIRFEVLFYWFNFFLVSSLVYLGVLRRRLLVLDGIRVYVG